VQGMTWFVVRGRGCYKPWVFLRLF
jgi:hypothetical protein